MASDQEMKKLLNALHRIADALETIASVVDEDEEELNVYVRIEDDDDDDD